MDIILHPLIEVSMMAIELVIWILVINAILSWLFVFNVVTSDHRFAVMLRDALNRLTEPLLRPIRGLLPDLGGIDVSPVILILGLIFLKMVLGQLALRM